MHRLHKADVGEHRLFVRGQRIRHQRRRADGVLNRIEQRQSGEHANSKLLFHWRQRLPGGNVVRQRHFLRQPEVAGQTVPDLQILIVLNVVPVNSANTR